jgi:hypothetical protein
MAKIIYFLTVIFLFSVPVSAQLFQEEPFSIDSASVSKDGKKITVTVPRKADLSDCYEKGEVRVDVVSKNTGKTETLRDTTFSLDSYNIPETNDYINLLKINLESLMGRYFQEKDGKKETVSQEEIDFIKRVGTNWRLILNRNK